MQWALRFNRGAPDLIGSAIEFQRFKRYMETLHGLYYISISKYKRKRTNPENSYYWGVIIEMLFKETGWFSTPDDWHEYLKATFNAALFHVDGKEIKVPRSTASLSTVEFEEYLSRIRTWAAMELNISIPEPNEA